MLTTILLGLLAIVLAAILWLLFMPLIIRIDTFSEVYLLRWGPVRATVLFSDSDARYQFIAPFYQREGSLFDLPDRQAPKTPRAARSNAVRSGTAPGKRPVLRIIQRVLRSFTVRRFQWYLDTGDPIWNAWLFPVFHLWRTRGADVRISFTGRTGLVFIAHNNAFRLLKAVLSGYINPSTPAFAGDHKRPLRGIKHQRHEQGHE
jgi:hypothetical protein